MNKIMKTEESKIETQQEQLDIPVVIHSAYLVYENVDDIPLCIYLDEELAKKDTEQRGKYFSYIKLDVMHCV